MKEVGTDAVTLAIAVADTGIGIAPDVIDKIFNEFTQASYETALHFGGTGLGLTITRKLLALYGSSVAVQSAPGRGIDVFVRPPAAAADQRQPGSLALSRWSRFRREYSLHRTSA